MAVGVAVIAALAAACSYAVAAVMQQAAAAAVPESESLRPRLVLDLLRRPLWLLGAALSVLSYVMQGVALAFGPLVLVLPLAAMDLVFALPLVARRRGRPVTRTEAVGALCTAGGVAAFLAVLPPSAGLVAPGLGEWLPLLALAAACLCVLVPVGWRRPGRVRTALYAAGAGVMFALLDSLTKSAAGLFRWHGTGALAHWEPYALLLAGGTGMLLAQSSFQAGPLTISLPVIDTLEPIGGVLMGAVVFQERLGTSWTLAVQVIGALAAVVGIVVLGRTQR
ncbi:DMT family transporter [Streptomyces sp. NPDC004065]|uniref:DMT family transporter n=1 Tax=Streptomyces sp. NPDC004065 TaxID=3364689 RepID=UPI00384EAD25